MALSDAEIKVLYADETGFILDESPAALLDFARAIESEVSKQLERPAPCQHQCEAQAFRVDKRSDTRLIRILVEALDDLAGAGEEAWSEERPCVRIGKEAASAGRARLAEGGQ